MTTVTITFENETPTGKAIGDIVEILEDGTLTEQQQLAITQWLYVNYRVAQDIEVVPDPVTP